MAGLLFDGFKRPHGLLNAYVEHFSSFKLTDAVGFIDSKGQDTFPVRLPNKIDFGKLKKSESYRRIQNEASTFFMSYFGFQ